MDDEVISELRRKGYRITTAARGSARAVRSSDHLTAEQVAAHAVPRTTPTSTHRRCTEHSTSSRSSESSSTHLGHGPAVYHVGKTHSASCAKRALGGRRYRCQRSTTSPASCERIRLRDPARSPRSWDGATGTSDLLVTSPASSGRGLPGLTGGPFAWARRRRIHQQEPVAVRREVVAPLPPARARRRSAAPLRPHPRRQRSESPTRKHSESFCIRGLPRPQAPTQISCASTASSRTTSRNRAEVP